MRVLHDSVVNGEQIHATPGLSAEKKEQAWLQQRTVPHVHPFRQSISRVLRNSVGHACNCTTHGSLGMNFAMIRQDDPPITPLGIKQARELVRGRQGIALPAS